MKPRFNLNICRIMAIAAIAMILAGCNKEPSIDATSMKTLKASSDAIRSTLSAADQAKFDASVTSIIVATVDPMTTLQVATESGILPTQEAVFAQIKPVFDKKTFTDLLNDGKAAQKKVEAQLLAWGAQKKKLESDQKSYEQLATMFATKFSPTSADLRLSTGIAPIFGDNQVEVDIQFKNDTGSAVEAMTFDLALMPPTVSTPWAMQPVKRKFQTPVPSGGIAKVKAGPINVNIPSSYKGDIKLEADIQVTSLKLEGKPELKAGNWDQASLLTLTKLDASIAGVEQALSIVKASQ